MVLVESVSTAMALVKTEPVVPAPVAALERRLENGRPVAGSKTPDVVSPCCHLPGSSDHLCWRSGNHLVPVITLVQ